LENYRGPPLAMLHRLYLFEELDIVIDDRTFARISFIRLGEF
jgi:hypothetical protein